MNTLLFDRAPGRAPLGRALTPWYQTASVRHRADPYSMSFGEFRQVKVVRENAMCWENYERVPGTEEGTEGSCRPKGSKKKKKKPKRGSSMYKKRENASRIYKKGEDADADGKTGEGKKKVTDFSDRNGNGKPDAFEKSSSSEYDSGSESDGEMNVSVTDSSSDDDGMKKKRSNASAADDDGCGCGCNGDPEKKKSDCGGSGLHKTISKAAKAEKKEKKKKDHVIHRANDGKHDFFVYHRGKKISFGGWMFECLPHHAHTVYSQTQHAVVRQATRACRTRTIRIPTENPLTHATSAQKKTTVARLDTVSLHSNTPVYSTTFTDTMCCLLYSRGLQSMEKELQILGPASLPK
jgi:hypothetical protein